MATRQGAAKKHAERRGTAPGSRPSRTALRKDARKDAIEKRAKAGREVQAPFVEKHMFARAKVSPKGWIVIPKAIRDEMGLRPGDEVTLNLSPPSPNMRQDAALYTVQLRRVPEDAVKHGRGLFARQIGQPSLAEELAEEHRLEVEKEERELRARSRRRRQTA